MTHIPAITIGLLTHNYGRYIREAIESVLAQTRADWELVICDDASTDDTPQIVAPYLSDTRVRYVRHEKNLGQGGNWGFALEQGTAPIVAVLHADDQYLPETLATVLPLFENDKELDLVYGNWWRLEEGEKERHLGKKEDAHLFSGHREFLHQVERFTCLVSAAFLSRRVISSAGKPRVDLKMIVDQEYFLRVFVFAHHIQSTPQPLTLYRVHNGSTTMICTRNGTTRAEHARLAGICAAYVDPHPKLRRGLRLIERSYAASVFFDGVNLLLRKDEHTGRQLIRQSLNIDPAILCDVKVALDWGLSLLGAIGETMLRRIHCKRLRSNVETT